MAWGGESLLFTRWPVRPIRTSPKETPVYVGERSNWDIKATGLCASNLLDRSRRSEILPFLSSLRQTPPPRKARSEPNGLFNDAQTSRSSSVLLRERESWKKCNTPAYGVPPGALHVVRRRRTIQLGLLHSLVFHTSTVWPYTHLTPTRGVRRAATWCHTLSGQGPGLVNVLSLLSE